MTARGNLIRSLMKSKNLIALATIAVILNECASNSLAQDELKFKQIDPPVLAALEDKSAKELVAILLQPEIQVRVPDNSRAQSHMVSLWDRAVSLLMTKLDEARPLLVELLNEESVDARVNAIRVLLNDDGKNLEDLRPRFLELLADPAPSVRILSARILPKIKNKEVETALLDALTNLHAKRSSSTVDSEIRVIVSALCTGPLEKEKVVKALLGILDESRSSRTVVWTTIQASTQLSRSKRYGADLVVRYWHILSTTEDDSLPYIVTGAMQDDDERTLPLLRKIESIANAKARGYAAAELVAHSGFDPQSEKALFKKLLNDASPWVRTNVIASLCTRIKGLTPKLKISIALKLFADDLDGGVKERALVGVFDVLHRTPKDARSDLLTDPELSIPTKMVNALGEKSLQSVIIYQTGHLAEVKWQANEGKNAIYKARNWWLQWKHNEQASQDESVLLRCECIHYVQS